MTKDEALKLALEAMEASHFLIHGSETKGGLAFCMDGYYSGCFDIDSNDKQTNKAITAIKEALAQQEQKPVAWVSTTELLVMRGNALGGAKDWRINVGLVKQDGDVGLYTIPPQRTWVGLTEDERDHLEGLHLYAVRGQVEAWIEGVDDFAKAIEAKLKEKNT